MGSSNFDHRQGAWPIRLVLKSLTCSGMALYQAAGHVIRGISCGSELVLAIVVAGCAGRPEPGTHTSASRCRCRCRAARRMWPCRLGLDGLRKGDTLEVKVRALLAERRQRIGYERMLVAATAACR